MKGFDTMNSILNLLRREDSLVSQINTLEDKVYKLDGKIADTRKRIGNEATANRRSFISLKADLKKQLYLCNAEHDAVIFQLKEVLRENKII